MAKLTLTPEATFKAKAFIPVAGSPDIAVEFTYKYRTSKELASVGAEIDKAETVAEQVMLVASGWELDDEFNDENVTLLVEQRPGALRAIVDTYLKESFGAREKN